MTTLIDIKLGIAAQIAHGVNREYCILHGDNSQLPWEEAPEWQKQSAIDGVRAIYEGKVHTPEDAHKRWMEHKAIAGWTYGPEKNSELKTHPCMVPYEELPPEQRAKDAVFMAVVKATL